MFSQNTSGSGARLTYSQDKLEADVSLADDNSAQNHVSQATTESADASASLGLHSPAHVVIGGAGSGKTTKLRKDLIDLLKIHSEALKAKGQQVKIISYTNTAVDNINERLADLSEYFDASTIHSFAWKFVSEYLEQAARFYFKTDHPSKPIGYEGMLGDLYLQAAKKSKQSIQQRQIPLVALSPQSPEQASLAQAAQQSQPNFLQANNSQANLRQNPNQPNPSQTSQVQANLTATDQVKYLTHDELIAVFTGLLRDETLGFAERVLEQYPYIFIDEAQDTDHDLALAFLAVYRRLFAQKFNDGLLQVRYYGDNTQSLYGKTVQLKDSNGSFHLNLTDCDNILSYVPYGNVGQSEALGQQGATKFSEDEVTRLTVNYRSHPNIVQLLNVFSKVAHLDLVPNESGVEADADKGRICLIGPNAPMSSLEHLGTKLKHYFPNVDSWTVLQPTHREILTTPAACLTGNARVAMTSAEFKCVNGTFGSFSGHGELFQTYIKQVIKPLYAVCQNPKLFKQVFSWLFAKYSPLADPNLPEHGLGARGFYQKEQRIRDLLNVGCNFGELCEALQGLIPDPSTLDKLSSGDLNSTRDTLNKFTLRGALDFVSSREREIPNHYTIHGVKGEQYPNILLILNGSNISSFTSFWYSFVGLVHKFGLPESEAELEARIRQVCAYDMGNVGNRYEIDQDTYVEWSRRIWIQHLCLLYVAISRAQENLCIYVHGLSSSSGEFSLIEHLAKECNYKQVEPGVFVNFVPTGGE